MRDIRTDLRERLATAEAKRGEIAASVDVLDAEIRALKNLLTIEDQRGNANGHSKRRPTMPLEEFMISKAAQRPMSKEELRLAARAEGFDVNGRHIHGHLMKLLRDGVLAISKEGIVATRT